MSSNRGSTILIVEDDRLLRRLTVETLDSERYLAIGVESAAEALACLAAPHEVALLITDINMAGMSGLDLVALVKEREPAMKILIMSGRERVADLALPPRTHFLQKPFSARQLVERVRILLAL